MDLFRFHGVRLLRSGCLLFLLVGVGFLGSAHAQGGLHYDALLGARYNPAGAALQSSAEYRYPLYDASSLVFAENFVAPKLSLGLSPANTKVGVGLVVQPLTILTLWAEARANYYFGTFRRIQSFESPAADFSDAAQKSRAKDKLHYASMGWQRVLGATFRLKYGNLALQTSYRLIWNDFELRAGEAYFYDTELDILSANGRRTIAGDSDLVYFAGDRLVIGLRHSLVASSYPKNSCSGSDCPSFNQRLGPMLGWKLSAGESKDALLDEMMLVGLINWYLEHSYRAGQRTSQFLPYIAIGIKVGGQV